MFTGKRRSMNVVLGANNFKEQNEAILGRMKEDKHYEFSEKNYLKAKVAAKIKRTKIKRKSDPMKSHRSNFLNCVNIRTKTKQPNIFSEMVSKLREKIDPEKIQKQIHKKNQLLKLFDRHLTDLKESKILNKLSTSKEFSPKRSIPAQKEDPWLKILNDDRYDKEEEFSSKYSKVSFYQKYKDFLADNSNNVLPDTFFKNGRKTPKKGNRRTVYASLGFGQKEGIRASKTPRNIARGSFTQQKIGLEGSISPNYSNLKNRREAAGTPVFSYKRTPTVATKTTRDNSKSQTSQNKYQCAKTAKGTSFIGSHNFSRNTAMTKSFQLATENIGNFGDRKKLFSNATLQDTENSIERGMARIENPYELVL